MNLCKISSWVGLMALAGLTYPASTLAQIDPGLIIPDGTLGEESSFVVRDTAVGGSLADLIGGGAIRDAALFHSFEEFNILTDQRVYFDNPEDIDNIISRVTGDFSSNIDGTLGVNGLANLYFINPNGIVFGPNAELDIGGAFTASTADSITFGETAEFSATNPNAPPLVTVNIPIGLQFGDNPPAALVNSAFLSVDGALLSLSGGEVVSSGQLAALEGNVRVEAVEGNVEIRALAPSRIAIDGQSVELLASEAVNIKGFVRASEDLSIAGASANIEDSQLVLNPGGFSEGARAEIAIQADDINIRNSALSADFVSSGEDGEAGRIDISGSGVTIDEGSTLSASFIVETDSTETTITGAAGEIEISANQISISDGSSLEVDVIEVDPSSFSTSARSFSAGVTAIAGEIVLNASDSITISNDSRLSNTVSLISEISEISEIDSSTTGQISIAASSLSVSDSEVSLSNRHGVDPGSETSVVATSVLGDQLTDDRGINIVAETITLDSGFILSEVGPNPGDGSGNINLTATDRLTLSNESLIEATGVDGATGGDISLENVGLLLGEPPTGSEGSDIVVRGEAETEGRSGAILLGANTSVSGFSFQQADPGNENNDIETDPLSPPGPPPVPPVPPEVDPNQPEEDAASDLQEPAGSFPPPFEQARRQCETANSEDNIPNGIVLTGRGGLPDAPSDLLEAKPASSDWVSQAVSPNQPEVSANWADGGIAAVPEDESDDEGDRTACRQTWAPVAHP